MYLINCHIENFGCLHDIDFDFEKGVNVFCEPNGWGKSTFAAFICAMFYGLDEPGGRKHDERKRFSPWNGGVFGGSLTIGVGDNEYTITRVFKAKEADDEFEIRNAKTNIISSDYSERIGDELFNISKSSFKRSAFISQSDCETFITDDINAKIGKLSEDTNDINNFATADDKLKDLLNKLNPRRATGSISKRREEITRLERIVRDGENLKPLMESLNKEYEAELINNQNIKAENKKLSNRQTFISRINEAKAKKDELGRLKKAKAEIDDKYSECIKDFPLGVPSYEELSTLTDNIYALENKKSAQRDSILSNNESKSLIELSYVFKDGVPSLEDIEDMKNVSNEIRVKTKELDRLNDEKKDELSIKTQKSKTALKTTGAFALIIGILLVLLYALKLLPDFGNIILFAAVGFLGISIVLLLAGILKKEPPFEEIVDDELEKLIDELEDFLVKYRPDDNGDPKDVLYAIKEDSINYQMLKKKELDGRSLVESLNNDEANIRQFFNKYGLNCDGDYKLSINKLREEINQLNEVSRMREQSVNAYEEFMKNEDTELINMDIPEDIESINDIAFKLDENAGLLDKSNKMLSEFDLRFEELNNAQNEWEDEKLHLANEKELQEIESKKYELLTLTKEFLNKAKENVTNKYRAPMLNGFKNYYGLLSTDNVDTFNMDANINLTYNDYGKQRDVAALSAGLRDLTGISLRLSLVDAMYEDEKPMIIMDDPFNNLDDGKLSRVSRFLDEVSNKYQIIYFTCSDSRSIG